MNARSKIDMMEATRLTREGRLEDAMAVLRGVLSSTPALEFRGRCTADRRPDARHPFSTWCRQQRQPEVLGHSRNWKRRTRLVVAKA